MLQECFQWSICYLLSSTLKMSYIKVSLSYLGFYFFTYLGWGSWLWISSLIVLNKQIIIFKRELKLYMWFFSGVPLVISYYFWLKYFKFIYKIEIRQKLLYFQFHVAVLALTSPNFNTIYGTALGEKLYCFEMSCFSHIVLVSRNWQKITSVISISAYL
jgi:ABC-type amino acid transport system permease subunit